MKKNRAVNFIKDDIHDSVSYEINIKNKNNIFIWGKQFLKNFLSFMFFSPKTSSPTSIMIKNDNINNKELKLAKEKIFNLIQSGFIVADVKSAKLLKQDFNLDDKLIQGYVIYKDKDKWIVKKSGINKK